MSIKLSWNGWRRASCRIVQYPDAWALPINNIPIDFKEAMYLERFVFFSNSTCINNVLKFSFMPKIYIVWTIWNKAVKIIHKIITCTLNITFFLTHEVCLKNFVFGVTKTNIYYNISFREPQLNVIRLRHYLIRKVGARESLKKWKNIMYREKVDSLCVRILRSPWKVIKNTYILQSV